MNKEEILVAIKEIQCRYSLPAFEANFTDKDYACKQYEKLVIHLAKQQEENTRLQQRIDKAIEVLKDANVDMDSILLCETIGYAIHILKGSDKE